jgi:hypothetical protein
MDRVGEQGASPDREAVTGIIRGLSACLFRLLAFRVLSALGAERLNGFDLKRYGEWNLELGRRA